MSASEHELALAQALDNTKIIFERFTVQQSRHAYVALVLWTAYTHAAGAFDFAPRLLLTSAEKRSGKSRTMEVASKLSAAPLIAANATVPAIFRSLDTPRTLFLDEADTIFGTRVKAEQNEDLRGLLNAGFQRGTPVIRTVGPSHEPTAFEVFSPACLAAIGVLPDTISDRAVNIRLRRRKPSESVEQYRSRRNDPELANVRESLSQAVGQVSDDLVHADPETPLEDRAADLWEPLLAVADAAGKSWPYLAREAAVYLTRQAAEEDHQQSEGIDLLTDVRQVLEWTKLDFIPTSDLIAKLKGIEESPWREIDLSPRRLADLLRAYSVHAHRKNTARGYKRAALEDAFERYLPAYASQASLPSRSAETHGTDSDASVTGDGSKRHPSPIRHSENPGNTPNVTEVTLRDAPRPGDGQIGLLDWIDDEREAS